MCVCVRTCVLSNPQHKNKRVKEGQKTLMIQSGDKSGRGEGINVRQRTGRAMACTFSLCPSELSSN